MAEIVAKRLAEHLGRVGFVRGRLSVPRCSKQDLAEPSRNSLK
jgi:hypothetical protein